MIKLLALAFLSLVSAIALAEQDPCEGGSKQAVALCASNKANAADAELNNAYQRALAAAGSGSPSKTALVAAQRQWLKFLQASCKLEQSFSVSEDDYLIWAARDECVARLSLERVKTLAYYACVFSEGATSALCSAP